MESYSKNNELPALDYHLAEAGLINEETMNESILWKLKGNIEKLLDQLGDRAICKGCGRQIWWVTHRNGKKAPYTNEALNHFADCPESEKFRNKKLENKPPF